MKTENKQGLSDQVRAMASKKYVRPARGGGQKNFSIRVKDVLEDLRAEGFPENHIPQICTALQGRKFQTENRVRIKDIQGPPSKMSTTVVINYILEDSKPIEGRIGTEPTAPISPEETPEAKATRMVNSLRGLLKHEFAKYGGGEAFFRWVRGKDEAE